MFETVKEFASQFWFGNPIRKGERIPNDVSESISKALEKQRQKTIMSHYTEELPLGYCLREMINERDRIEAILYKDTHNFIHNLKQLVRLDENIIGLIGEVER